MQSTKAILSRITSAYYVSKNHANALDTFYAKDQGHLGFFLNQVPNFYFTPSTPTAKPFFDISRLNLKTLPQVDILFGHQDSNPALIRAAASSGAKGIVFAGPGAGYWTEAGRAVAKEVFDEMAIPMVFSTRTGKGFVPPFPPFGEGGEWRIAGSTLDPQKCRILLQLAIATGMEAQEIGSLFESLQTR